MATKKKTERTPVNSTDKGERVPIGNIPEVQEFMDIENDIAQLKAAHYDVFSQLDDLIDRRNTALEKAEKEVRARGVTCGPFENFTAKTVYDAEKMYDELGHEQFLAVGGIIKNVTKYEVDKEKVELAIAQKKIPKECVQEFRTVQKAYHVPDKIEGL